MFAKNKVSQSLVDAVNKIMSEKEVESKEELLNEAEKVPTATGMKVYGSSYGDSQKARKDQLKSNVDDVKEPSTREITGKDPDLKYKKDTGQKRNYRVHAGRYFSNMDTGTSSKGREEPRYKNEEVVVDEELKGNQHKIDKNKNNKIDAEDFKMLRKEELKGNQHKIDANKNNKIDAHDFQLLRGKKKVKEDTFAAKLLNSLSEKEGTGASDPFEQIDEKNAPTNPALWSRAKSLARSKFDVYPSAYANGWASKWYKGKGGSWKSVSEEVELNEVSKSEVDHHYDKWTTSDSAPNHHDAGDDPKIHKSALKYLRSTDVPKENHEKLAMHIANKFHGSGIDEAAPKKMDDVAKQNLEPAKKGVVGTVKSDFKNFKSFLAGKKETNEEVESLDEDRYLMKYLLSRGINPKYVDRNTRVGHAKSNEFKKWKADHLNSLIVTRESNEMPFDGPYIKTKKNVKDKSGAVHTPMSRARNLARAALKSVQDKTKIK